MSRITLNVKSKPGNELKVGMPILFCGGRYEITCIEDGKRIDIYDAELNLKVTCDIDSPHLKRIEGKKLEKENK